MVDGWFRPYWTVSVIYGTHSDFTQMEITTTTPQRHSSERAAVLGQFRATWREMGLDAFVRYLFAEARKHPDWEVLDLRLEINGEDVTEQVRPV